MRATSHRLGLRLCVCTLAGAELDTEGGEAGVCRACLESRLQHTLTAALQTANFEQHVLRDVLRCRCKPNVAMETFAQNR